MNPDPTVTRPTVRARSGNNEERWERIMCGVVQRIRIQRSCIPREHVHELHAHLALSMKQDRARKHVDDMEEPEDSE